MEDTILQGCSRLEIYNSNFTSNFDEFALGFCGGVYGKENSGSIHRYGRPLQSVTSLDLSKRCIHNVRQKVGVVLEGIFIVSMTSFCSLLTFF